MSDVVSEPLIRYSDEVREALARRAPIVALESNVVAHGFRRPENVAVAREVEAVVRIDDPAEIAELARLHRQLNDRGSVLVTHPIPVADALDGDRIETAIQQALAHAAAEGIAGPAITTFVLRAVNEATGGDAAAANRAVLLSTTRAATEIEVARSAAERAAVDRITHDQEVFHAI
ncbi:pseudouridine-5'-phosphate glycosidase [Nocardia crassostreae]|uniref:pseudouridine-5'-phosphate glycosidase n=1 Tax=Nocardia crassostreae TaxID=53428 RepID=UPI0008375640|nr:pseudouridine-5'-phosphate glycosidase [Nocardia crassostreae]